jgi:hypothetical protein
MLSQGALTNPIGLPRYYQQVVPVRMIGSLTFHKAKSFGSIRSDSTATAKVLSATVFSIELLSIRFAFTKPDTLAV